MYNSNMIVTTITASKFSLRNGTADLEMELGLSRERLNKYFAATGNDRQEALNLYERNTPFRAGTSIVKPNR